MAILFNFARNTVQFRTRLAKERRPKFDPISRDGCQSVSQGLTINRGRSDRPATCRQTSVRYLTLMSMICTTFVRNFRSPWRELVASVPGFCRFAEDRQVVGVELCGGSGYAGFSGLDQLVEDGTVLDHRATELFCGGFAAAGTGGDCVCQSVVINNKRIVD